MANGKSLLYYGVMRKRGPKINHSMGVRAERYPQAHFTADQSEGCQEDEGANQGSHRKEGTQLEQEARPPKLPYCVFSQAWELCLRVVFLKEFN